MQVYGNYLGEDRTDAFCQGMESERLQVVAVMVPWRYLLNMAYLELKI